jgi:SAM-dependent methyltransferase
MTATAVQTAAEFDQLKSRLKATWMTGDYDCFSRYLESGARGFFAALGIPAGAELLDVACGSGQLALIAARAGVRATGCDIATNWIEKARERAIAERLDARFDEGDAEALPYDDRSFDAVTTIFGAMFAPRPDRVAAELSRVCRPGGIIAMANWTPTGFIGQMFKVIARHIAPSGMPAPVLWGDESTVAQRFNGYVNSVGTTRRMYPFEYPFPPAEVVEFFRVNYGPMSKAFASVNGGAQEALRDDLVALWSSHNEAPSGATLVNSEYLQVVATR